jgi:hypothetical protein
MGLLWPGSPKWLGRPRRKLTRQERRKIKMVTALGGRIKYLVPGEDYGRQEVVTIDLIGMSERSDWLVTSFECIYGLCM